MANIEPDGQFAQVNGVNVHFHDIGTGPVLFMLHGSGPGATGWSNYHRNVPDLARSRRVICPDLPGFGKSDVKPVDAPMPGYWAEIVSGLMDHLGIDTADFVGNSMGGMISLKLALEAPERVGRMVLMGPGGSTPVTSQWPSEGIKQIIGFYEGDGPSMTRMQAFASQFVYDPAQLTEDLLEARLKAATDPRIVAQPPMRIGAAGMPEELWRDKRLTGLTHETLIIWGREDRVLPLDMAFSLIGQLPHARLFVMPQCGHWVQWEHAAEFNQLVSNFLAGPA